MYEKSTFNKEKLSMRIISYGRKILVLSVQLSVFSVMGGGQWPKGRIGETGVYGGWKRQLSIKRIELKWRRYTASFVSC